MSKIRPQIAEKKEKVKCVHMSISVPEDLKDKMRSSEFANTNWSSVAVRAFRRFMKVDDPSLEGKLAKLAERLEELETKHNGRKKAG